MAAIATRAALAVPRLAGQQGLHLDARVVTRRAAVVALLAAAILTAVGAAAAGEEQHMVNVATADRGSLVLVSACAPGQPDTCRSSTAFSVGPGLFVTAAHALLGSSQVTVSTLTHGTAVARVDRLDAADDIVLLRSSLQLPALHTAAPTAGEPAVVVCSRRAIAADGVDGRPANYVGRIGGAPIRVDDGAQPLLLERVAGAASVLGCSGSPVLDRTGAVSGVLVGGDGESAGMVDARRVAALVAGR